jgi:hypothetical protein
MIRRLSRFTSHAAIALIVVAFCSVEASAQQDARLASINYSLAMSSPASHLFEVKIEAELSEGSSADYLDFQMPKWSPGRYSVFDFAKNVRKFKRSMVSARRVRCATCYRSRSYD